MIIEHNGFKYSASAQNELKEYVVAKLTMENQVLGARVIKVRNAKKLEKVIKNGGFNNYPLLEGSTQE